MRFTGQVRIPEVDHPGIPATILIEENQIEILLDGEGLGRWSLYDVHARRLVSAAFQLELDGEEITFVADEPIDFAYRGVDHMAEAWARIKAMRSIPRSMAVKKSRGGTKPSRIAELRQVMEVNLEAEAKARRQRTTMATPSVFEPTVSESPAFESPAPAAAAPAVDVSDLLAEERSRLEDERRSLEMERERLEELRREAEERDARRIEAFRLEMARLEAERAEHERIELERSRQFQEELDRLRSERAQLQEMDQQMAAKAGEDAAREAAINAELARLEAARLEMEQAEAERVAAAQKELEDVEARRLELERLEEVRVEMEEKERLLAEAAAAEAAAAEAAEAAAATAAEEEAESEPAESVEPDEPDEPLAPDEGTRGVLVDLDVLQEDKEPAMAAAMSREKSGLMGAVRSAFTRGSRNHEHDLVPAPGGLGISRSICRECGYVSISATD